MASGNSKDLPQTLEALKVERPHEYEFMCSVVRAAYKLGFERGGTDTLDLLEKVTEVYGIRMERSAE